MIINGRDANPWGGWPQRLSGSLAESFDEQKYHLNTKAIPKIWIHKNVSRREIMRSTIFQSLINTSKSPEINHEPCNLTYNLLLQLYILFIVSFNLSNIDRDEIPEIIFNKMIKFQIKSSINKKTNSLIAIYIKLIVHFSLDVICNMIKKSIKYFILLNL